MMLSDIDFPLRPRVPRISAIASGTLPRRGLLARNSVTFLP
jgi:hypothetical protein